MSTNGNSGSSKSTPAAARTAAVAAGVMAAGSAHQTDTRSCSLDVTGAGVLWRTAMMVVFCVVSAACLNSSCSKCA